MGRNRNREVFFFPSFLSKGKGLYYGSSCGCRDFFFLSFYARCVYKCASAFVCLRVKGAASTADPKI